MYSVRHISLPMTITVEMTTEFPSSTTLNRNISLADGTKERFVGPSTLPAHKQFQNWMVTDKDGYLSCKYAFSGHVRTADYRDYFPPVSSSPFFTSRSLIFKPYNNNETVRHTYGNMEIATTTHKLHKKRITNLSQTAPLCEYPRLWQSVHQKLRPAEGYTK